MRTSAGRSTTSRQLGQRALIPRLRSHSKVIASPAAPRPPGPPGGWRTRGSPPIGHRVRNGRQRRSGYRSSIRSASRCPLHGGHRRAGRPVRTAFPYRHRLEIEALQPVVHVRAAFDLAASRPRVRSRLDGRPDDVRVEDLRHQFQFAQSPAIVVEPCHGVHVLLRHRPPSIPPRATWLSGTRACGAIPLAPAARAATRAPPAARCPTWSAAGGLARQPRRRALGAGAGRWSEARRAHGAPKRRTAPARPS